MRTKSIKNASVFRDECHVSPNAKFPDNIPEYRSDMNQQLFCMIQLQPGQSEYDTVKNKFSQTCLSYRIEKVILHFKNDFF